MSHIISRDGLNILNKRIESIKNMPDPMNVKRDMTILVMITYTCKFFPNVSGVTEPLPQLIKDSSKPCHCLMFEERHKQSFAELKKMMSSTEVLQHYSPSKPVTI